MDPNEEPPWLEWEESVDRVIEILDAVDLSERERQVMEMSTTTNLSDAQIGDELGISKRSVLEYRNRAAVKLRRYLVAQ